VLGIIEGHLRNELAKLGLGDGFLVVGEYPSDDLLDGGDVDMNTSDTTKYSILRNIYQVISNNDSQLYFYII
jgi:hypothetical protein